MRPALDAAVASAEQPDAPEGSAASEPSAGAAGANRLDLCSAPSGGSAGSSNIVPIRPGALDALARETAPSFPAESVELSRSERDAFREIARALVGRAPASRDDAPDERTGAHNRREPGIDARAEQPTNRPSDVMPRAAAPTTTRFGATPAPCWTVFRSAPWSSATGSALYANRTLLELIGYRDFAEFQVANGLSRMFRDRDPQADGSRGRRRGRDRQGGRAEPVRRRPRAGDRLGRRAGDADRAAPLAGSRAAGQNARRRERDAEPQRLGKQRPADNARPGERRRRHARCGWPHPVLERAGRAPVRLPSERDRRREPLDAARAAEPPRDDRTARSLKPRGRRPKRPFVRFRSSGATAAALRFRWR